MPRLTSDLTQRRLAAMESDPAGLEAHVRATYGHSVANLDSLMKIVSRLSTDAGATLRASDIATIARCYPGVGKRTVESLAAQINRLPYSQRADASLYVMLGGDERAAADYDGMQSSLKEVKELLGNYTTAEMVRGINEKTPGGVEAREPWRPEPGSIRDLIEQQVNGKGQRVMEMVRSNADAQQLHRESLALRLEDAQDHLAAADVLPLRDIVASAYEHHEVEDIAVNEGYLDGKE